MPIKILMPALSPTMKEGNLVKWVKTEGDRVHAGDVLAEIETDKATMEVEAVDEGRLGKIIVPEGSEAVAVNSVIAILLEEDEEDSALDEVLRSLQETSGTQSHSLTPLPKEEISLSQPISEQTPEISKNMPELPLSQQARPSKRILASPLARRIALEKGLDLEYIQGSGPYGRIIRADVLNQSPQRAAFSSSPSYPTRKEGLPAFEVVKLTNMRKVIAQRLTQSKQNVPHFYLSLRCHIDKLLELRQDINSTYPDNKLSVNDMIVRASALALRDVPDANVAWGDDHIKRYQTSDISFAVALKDGLITPVVRNAHLKSLLEIAQETRDLIQRAREGKLKPEEFQGGTMSVSNLGMFGIEDFCAIVNPPQACILAVGAGQKKPVVKEDTISIATVMCVTLSVDHRAIDGAVAAAYLKTFKDYIETPIRLLL